MSSSCSTILALHKFSTFLLHILGFQARHSHVEVELSGQNRSSRVVSMTNPQPKDTFGILVVVCSCTKNKGMRCSLASARCKLTRASTSHLAQTDQEDPLPLFKTPNRGIHPRFCAT